MRGADLDEIDRIIGKGIAFFRLKAGLTHEQLGDMLGMTAPEVRKCESGKNPLPASRLPIVCEVLNIRIGQLLDVPFSEEPLSRILREKGP